MLCTDLWLVCTVEKPYSCAVGRPNFSPSINHVHVICDHCPVVVPTSKVLIFGPRKKKSQINLGSVCKAWGVGVSCSFVLSFEYASGTFFNKLSLDSARVVTL